MDTKNKIALVTGGSRGLGKNMSIALAKKRHRLSPDLSHNKELNAQIAGLTALGRVGLPDDIGGVVAFLCTDEAYWINGQRIEVSGGQTL